MCGRYWIDPEDEEMIDGSGDVKLSGDILPGDHTQAICFSRARNIRSFSMQWGWKMSSGQKLINARSETAAVKRMFSESMEKRRCLLKMSAYYEWEKRGRDKIKYRIYPEAKGEYFLGGLYRFEEEGPVFTVLTMEASEEIRFIHPRMPLIIGKDRSVQWLADRDFRIEAPGMMTYELAL